jgi:tetratricopeptide (TPR) repeat protein
LGGILFSGVIASGKNSVYIYPLKCGCMRHNTGLFLFGVLALSLLFSCKEKPKDATDLGTLVFEVNGKDEAQPLFKKGLLLLHSFEYEDAAEAFREAIKLDPGFAMAYWGETMTCNHPIWQEQDLEKGNAILNELAPTAGERLALAKTEIEKDFLRALHLLFGEGNKAERDSSYASFMEGLYKKYPGNNEVASFYSLALIGWAVTGKELSVSERAAEVALEVLGRNPNHPGALHYAIHAWDHPEYAQKALDAANKYAGVAPGAAHALHMPTHTYLALGMWDQVVFSNIVSWASSIERKERKQLSNDALGYHSFHWLQYGYLQKGEKAIAKAMLDSMKAFTAAKPSGRARSHVVLMQSTYLAETNDYSPGTASFDTDISDLNIGLRAANHFSQGMYAWHQKDAAMLESIIQKMKAERMVDADRISGEGLRMCGSINRSLPTRTNLVESETMEMQLRAMHALLTGDDKKAEACLQQAVALQDAAGYSFGPPGIVKPPYEMYGEWLLDNGRADEAILQFEKALKYAPNRLLSVNGKNKAEKMAGKGNMAMR